MTQKQIDEYNKRYDLELWLCYCGKRASQIAHRICKSKTNYLVYGKEIVDNINNLVPVCGLEHNARVNIGNKPEQKRKLIKLIKSGDTLSVKYINKILEE